MADQTLTFLLHAPRPQPPSPPPKKTLHAEDVESAKCHLGAIVVRDLSCVVSNYRSVKDLDT